MLAQDSNDVAYEFFSGVVVDFSSDRITVERSVLGKEKERRTFSITGDTKIEGRPARNARVTVGFNARGDSDVALRIIVREE